MNKKNMLICLGILGIIIFLILVIVLYNFSKRNVKESYKLVDEIISKFDNKEDLLIYVTDSSDKCGGTCIDSIDIIKYYKKIYKLEFIEFDKNKEGKEEYKTLINKLNIEDAVICVPAVIIIKEGIVKSIANIDTEEYLRKYLLENNFISENNKDKDFQINYSEFENMYNSSDTNLFFIYSYGIKNYEFRENLFNLSSEFKFKYSAIYVGTIDNSEIVNILMKEVRRYSVPMLFITKDGKVIDYTTSNSKNKIKEFLEKNEIINS